MWPYVGIKGFFVVQHYCWEPVEHKAWYIVYKLLRKYLYVVKTLASFCRRAVAIILSISSKGKSYSGWMSYS